MYIPEQFQENHQNTLLTLIKNIQAANLITQHPCGMISTFLPLHLEKENTMCLYGHLAKNNPQWQEPLTNSQALTIFTGPHAYISPSWYAAKQEHHKVVPTWDYLSIHAYGKIEFFHDHPSLLTLLKKLTHTNEKQFQHPWKIDDAPPEFIQSMLNAIVGVKLSITRIEGQIKLSQNKSGADQQNIIKQLRKSQKDMDKALSTLMSNEISK